MKMFNDARRLRNTPVDQQDFLTEVQRLIEAIPDFEDIEVTFGTANTSVTVNLIKLNKTPTKYYPVKMDRACIVYETSTSSWGDNLLFLKCDTASAVVTMRVE